MKCAAAMRNSACVLCLHSYNTRGDVGHAVRSACIHYVEVFVAREAVHTGDMQTPLVDTRAVELSLTSPRGFKLTVKRSGHCISLYSVVSSRPPRGDLERLSMGVPGSMHRSLLSHKWCL